MNGAAFVNLPQLVKLDLRSNDCINRLFEIKSGSKAFRRKILRNCASSDVVKNQLSCITYTACNDIYMYQQYCCELEFGTIIDAPDYTFATERNYSAFKTLTIAHQQNVDYLPISVHERFPILTEYYVKNTAVSRISKNNFEKMFQLEELHLDRNEIEVIKSDTFEDLVNLKVISISRHLKDVFVFRIF